MIVVPIGGGSGATLVVTGVAGDTCTISMGNKSYTKTFGTDKKATFKGLATGTWTVKMTNSAGKSATKTVTITADYAATITYFSATIKVTYPANSKCVIKNSSGTQVASNTNTGTSAKTWTATVGATGTYTIIATSTADPKKTKSTTVSITANGQSVSATLTYELIVYKPGDTNSGWSMRKDEGSVKFATNALTIDTSYNMGGYTYTNLRYNTPFLGGDFKTLTAIVTALSGFNTELGVVTEANKDTYKNNTPTFAAKVSIGSIKTWTLDLSALTPNNKYYIVTHSYGRNLGSDEVVHPSSITFTSIKAT